jgi:15-cis-phytoene desaturase
MIARTMTKRVLIMGGGIGGLTAAHELAERGFDVTVLEGRATVGGKARSYPVPGTGTGGRKDLPGEHGFRFFPGFYKHVPDTMKRVTSSDGKLVSEHLVTATKFMMARTGGVDPIYFLKLPKSPAEFLQELRALFIPLGIPVWELADFTGKMFHILKMSHERRLAELEKISWWDYLKAGSKSQAFQDLLARGMTRTLVALRAEEGSTRTVGTVLIQLLMDFGRGELDRLLDGPTSDVWIDPWRTQIQGLGAKFVTGAKVTKIHADATQITKVTATLADGSTQDYTADYFVSAVPLEVFRPLVTHEIKRLDPSLDGLRHLKTSWMNGIQFYLKRDVPLASGHILFVDTPWALTAVSQAQFWTTKLAEYGDGEVRGILSVDVSNWDAPGVLYGLPANQIQDREKIKNEVWEQMKRALNDDAIKDLSDDNIAAWSLDDAIVIPNPTGVANLEPLLVNTVDTWRHRPEAATAVPNLFIAADFVRTYTDLATMEAANEAGRRATNAILERAGSSATKCGVWPLEEPAIFDPFQAADKILFELGLPALP